jgi:FkbM family methyltransferase
MATDDTPTPAPGLSFPRKLIAELSRLLDVMSIAEPGQRLRVPAIWLVLVLKRRLGIRRELGLRLRWRGPRSTLEAVVSDASELRVIREVFVNGEYDVPAEDPRLILDLGSNAGFSVLYFRDRYPAASIIAVEPARRAFARLERNVGGLPDVRLLRAAVVAEDQPVRLHTGWQSWNSSLFADHDAYETEEVDGLSVESVLAACGAQRADIVKLDIEGAEGAVLRSSAALREADHIVFEFHAEHTDDDVWSLIRSFSGFAIDRLQGNSQEHPLVTLARRPASADE